MNNQEPMQTQPEPPAEPKPGDVGVWDYSGALRQVVFLGRHKNEHGRDFVKCGDVSLWVLQSEIQWHHRLAVVPAPVEKTCEWIPYEDSTGLVYGTSCRVGEIAYEDEPNLSNHPFCPGCGRRVEVREKEETK